MIFDFSLVHIMRYQSAKSLLRWIIVPLAITKPIQESETDQLQISGGSDRSATGPFRCYVYLNHKVSNKYRIPTTWFYYICNLVDCQPYKIQHLFISYLFVQSVLLGTDFYSDFKYIQSVSVDTRKKETLYSTD